MLPDSVGQIKFSKRNPHAAIVGKRAHNTKLPLHIREAAQENPGGVLSGMQFRWATEEVPARQPPVGSRAMAFVSHSRNHKLTMEAAGGFSRPE
jgi:hypothetical protein